MSNGVPFGGITAPAIRQLLERYLKPWCFQDISPEDIVGVTTNSDGDIMGAVQTDGVTIQGDGLNTDIALIEPVKYATREVSVSPDPVQDTDVFLVATVAGADLIENLPPSLGPDAAGRTRILIFIRTDATAFHWTLVPDGTDTIDGVNADVNIDGPYNTMRLISRAPGAWLSW
jgi:hypothetical protein